MGGYYFTHQVIFCSSKRHAKTLPDALIDKLMKIMTNRLTDRQILNKCTNIHFWEHLALSTASLQNLQLSLLASSAALVMPRFVLLSAPKPGDAQSEHLDLPSLF